MNSKIVVLVAVCFIATGSLAIAMDKADSSPMGVGQKASAAKDSQTEVWVCPMKHYEGPNTKDGKCPKCGMKLEKKAISKEEKFICPVSDEKAYKKYSLEYKGKTYYFCCSKCITKFKANPEKYLKGEVKEEKHHHSH
ncbi:MAG: YHS domain-containing protein [Candidatus Firestonebacteria bacterium]